MNVCLDMITSVYIVQENIRLSRDQSRLKNNSKRVSKSQNSSYADLVGRRRTRVIAPCALLEPWSADLLPRPSADLVGRRLTGWSAEKQLNEKHKINEKINERELD